MHNYGSFSPEKGGILFLKNGNPRQEPLQAMKGIDIAVGKIYPGLREGGAQLSLSIRW